MLLAGLKVITECYGAPKRKDPIKAILQDVLHELIVEK